MNILFRADSSSTVGTGHIMRDLVLAEQFNDVIITFATQALPGNINHKIEEKDYVVEILNSNDVEELDTLIKKLSIDMIVIDHYGIDHTFEKQLKTQNSKLKIFSLDDTYEKHYCDILLNHNIYAEPKRYRNLVPEHCELRCGSKYTLLRDEFRQAKQQQKLKHQYSTFNIILMMGGSDIANLNPEIIKVLSSFQNIHVNVVTTNANTNLDALKKFITSKSWITLHINATNIAELMTQSDLAIVTPSVSMNEVWYMELPYIAIKVADNQGYMHNYLKNIAAENVLEQFDEKVLLSILSKTISTEVILKPFTSLTIDETNNVLKWRNDDNVRKWMYNTDIISLNEHLSYIDSLDEREDRLYFLVNRSGKAIGVIDFTSIDKEVASAEIGLYSDPETRGNGQYLMQSIIGYAFDTLQLKKLRANVLLNNIPAIKLYKRYGFIEQHRDNKLVYMELTNENR